MKKQKTTKSKVKSSKKSAAPVNRTSIASGAAASFKRVRTGVPGLDTVLDGGFLQGGTYLILGVPGTGKTILANQICFHQLENGGKND